MANAGTTVFIEGSNSAGQDLIGATGLRSGAGENNDVKIKGNNSAGRNLVGLSGPTHESADTKNGPMDLKTSLGSGGIAGVVFGTVTAMGMIIGLAVTCCKERYHIAACFGCQKKPVSSE